MASLPNVSLNTLAMVLSLVSGQRVSKQGVDKRVGQKAIDFIGEVLLAALRQLSQDNAIRDKGVFSSFNRVLLQDSTHIRLPNHLADLFPGSRNQTDKPNSIMKIQLLYELFTEKVHEMSLSGYNRNDQDASGDILDHADFGDLVLRDLGYFSTPVFKKMDKRGIKFISRLHNRLALYDPVTGERLDLLHELTKSSSLDRPVLLGSKEKLAVRLVAVPLPDEVANERRRKAKKSRDKRCNPTKAKLQLLGWEIFITNVDESVWSTEVAAKAYFCRWRIELIFKVWKSHFRLSAIPKGSKVLVLICIMSRLLHMIWFHNLYDLVNQRVVKMQGKHVSIQKLSDFSNALYAFESIGMELPDDDHLVEDIIRTLCTYEKRKRMNYYQNLMALG